MSNDPYSAAGTTDGNPASQGGGYYPPTRPPTALGYPPVQPPRKSNTGKTVLIVVLVIVGLCGIASVVGLMGLGGAAKSVDDQIKKGEQIKTASVTLVPGSCKKGEFGGFQAKVKITNSTKDKESYWAQVDLMTADGKTKLGEAHAITNDLAPGASTTVTADGQIDNDGKFPKGAQCVVGDVS